MAGEKGEKGRRGRVRMRPSGPSVNAARQEEGALQFATDYLVGLYSFTMSKVSFLLPCVYGGEVQGAQGHVLANIQI